MNKTVKGFLAGIVVTTILFSTAFSVYGASVEKMISVFFNNIKIYVDGNVVESQNPDGSKIEPFIYKGTTYLPVRSISEALNQEVKWDGTTNSIYIGKAPTEVNAITVGSAEEFIKAIGPNRKIILKPGEYNLSKLPKGNTNNDFVTWEEVYDGHELVIRNISNLTIEGDVEGISEIIVEPRYANVLNFINAENINVSNITIGHTPQGECAGGVFYFEDSSNIKISNSNLYGCGTEGLKLFGVNNLKLIDSKIYECSNGIMFVRGSQNLEFINCQFVDNKEYDMIYIDLSSDITFDGCEIANNQTRWDDSALFYIRLSSNIVVKDSNIHNNRVGNLLNDKNAVTFVNTTFDNNTYMGGQYGEW